VPRIAAHDVHHAAAADDLALVTHPPNAGTHFHRKAFQSGNWSRLLVSQSVYCCPPQVGKGVEEQFSDQFWSPLDAGLETAFLRGNPAAEVVKR
jgi:hypothetical protein